MPPCATCGGAGRARVLLLAVACAAGLQATAQSEVDSLKRLLARTVDPVEHLKVLRQLSRADDTTTMRIYAYATVRYADSLLAHGHAGDFTVLTQQGGGLWNVGTQYFRRGLPDSAYVWYRKAADHWKRIGDAERTAFASSQLAEILTTRGQAREALAMLKETLAAHEALHDTIGITDDHSALGHAYLNLGDHPRGLDHYFQALALHGKADLPDGGASIFSNIGLLYEEQEQTDTALAYFRRAVQAARGSISPTSACMAFNNIASIELGRKNYPAALKACKEGLALVGRDRFPVETGQLYATLGAIYQQMGELDQAVTFGERAVAAATRGVAPTITALTHIQLGRTWLLKGRYARALEQATKAKALADSNVVEIDRRRDIAGLFADIYAKTGPPDKALEYYRAFMAWGDSMHHADVRRQFALKDLRDQERADSVRAAAALNVQAGTHRQELGAETGRKRLFMYGGLAVLVVAGGLWWRLRHTRRAKRSVEHERDRSDTLLHNILPSSVAQELKNTGEAQARDIDNVSILFTDFKGFTQLSEQLTAQELVAEIDTCFKAFDGIIGRHGVEKIKTIGDAYMAAGGLPAPTADSARGTVLAALEMQAFMVRYAAERSAQGKPAFTMRVGIHTGPVVAGIVGVKKFQYDIWGDTVNIASRMESSGEVGRVNISGSTYTLVKDAPGLSFTARGKVQAKGKGELEMYYVERAGERPDA